MATVIPPQEDGWYADTMVSESLPYESESSQPNHHQSTQLPASNALGLEFSRTPSRSNSSNATYYAGTPHPSGYVHALMDDTLSASQHNSMASPLTEHSTTPHGDQIELSPQPSPTFPLRSIPLAVAGSLVQPPSTAFSFRAQPLPPALLAPPQLSANLPHLSAPARLIARPPAPSKRKEGQRRKSRKRKRTDEGSPGDSGEDEGTFHPVESRVRPAMLSSSSHTAPANIQSATPHLSIVGCNDNVSDDDMGDYPHPLSAGDEQVVQTLYEKPVEGSVVDLRNLCELVHKLLEDQAELANSVKQIDTRTQQMATRPPVPSTKDGDYVSPPEPAPPINWDQNVHYDAPAGRKPRAKRRVLLMGLIRETIFRLLSRRSVHDPLPGPPPPALQVPTLLNFAVRWEESSKSVFNRLAADIVAQKIISEQPIMLGDDEAKELPSMVSKHIKYLCRCYKDQNRQDAKDFNSRRLSRCGAGTRKRQLYATRLQVIDMFPQHLGKHRHLLSHLGVDGTSSDEEDPKGSGTYRIKSMPQLSSKVTLLKRDIDQVYQLYFKGPGSKGSQVHRRVPSDIASTRSFSIQGLPITCVSRAWYQRLQPEEQEFYQFSAHNYDFSFPQSLLNVRAPNQLIGAHARDVSP